jgi:hypothetical protein
VQFNKESDHWLDVGAFPALLSACDTHGHAGIEVCGECVDRLEEAVRLYRGTFLEGFSLVDAEEFEAWCLLEREVASFSDGCVASAIGDS